MNHTLLHARALGFIVLLSLPACNGDSGGGGTTCEPGTVRCPCDNGSCNAGLTCLSNVCVQGTAGSGGTAGNPQGGSGGANTGGTNAGGSNTGGTSTGGSSTGGASGGGTGGQSVGGAGGNPAGGAGSGGVATGGSGGVSGSGGTGGTTCENTQTDPMNCGQCGHVCRSQDPQFRGGGCASEVECCVGGSCLPYFGACITEASGFGTCVDYCLSIGEQCVTGGCRTRTWSGYADGPLCNDFRIVDHADQDPCDTPIEWTDTSRYVRCCCTDTQP